MVEIVSDNQSVEQAIRHLCRLIIRYGGVINDQLVVNCHGNDISIHAPQTIRPGERILTIPKDILLPVSAFRIALESNQLVLADHIGEISGVQVEIMQALLEIFNRTQKIIEHKRASTVLNWRQTEPLFKCLEKGRSALVLPFLENLHKRDEEQFIISSFFGTRVFTFRGHVPGGEQGDSQVLMPMIGFLNNHPQAHSYLTNFDALESGPSDAAQRAGQSKDGIMTLKSCPVADSDECFVSYGNYDAMDTLINYNYVERHAAFVCSIPLNVVLPGDRKIAINTVRRQPQHKNLPQQLRDLASYLPQMQVDTGGKTIALDFVLIPQRQAPYSMRRVLGVALSQIDAGLTRRELLSALKQAERHIIAENHIYFSDLLDICTAAGRQLEPNPVLQNATELARVQLDKIENYQFFAETRGQV